MAERSRRSDDFPTTQRSALFGLKSGDAMEKARSIDRVATAYWKPLYKYVRLRWKKTPPEAEELTQSFFLHAIDRRTFNAYEPAQARFRTFLRVCVDRFVVDAARHDAARKRGGGARLFDFQTAENELASESRTASDPEKLFEVEWVRSIFESAVESLRVSCKDKGKEVHFRVFELLQLSDQRLSYAAVAAELGISVTDVTNRLSYARREFRAIVLDVLREVTASEQELRDEARAVLGLEL